MIPGLDCGLRPVEMALRAGKSKIFHMDKEPTRIFWSKDFPCGFLILRGPTIDKIVDAYDKIVDA